MITEFGTSSSVKKQMMKFTLKTIMVSVHSYSKLIETMKEFGVIRLMKL